ncbi:transmembrane protein 42 [Cloeon dipterum]|uniref:transmembrane protein 42 n=1 Tax=Cloeon dipterum TaxID=197152 RepID=UPI00322024CD
MFPGKLQFAFIAGISAALGSVFGKLSGSPELLEVVPKLFIYADTQNLDLIEYLIFIVQGICFALMIFCNASVWSFYVRALQSSNSSLPATVVSTATNYIVSAIFGIILFGEATGFLWWTGTCLVIIGLALISNGAKSAAKTD